MTYPSADYTLAPLDPRCEETVVSVWGERFDEGPCGDGADYSCHECETPLCEAHRYIDRIDGQPLTVCPSCYADAHLPAVS